MVKEIKLRVKKFPVVKQTYYTVMYEEDAICNHGFHHTMPVVMAHIPTLERATEIALNLNGTIEEIVEETEIIPL